MYRISPSLLASVAGIALSFAAIGCQPERPDVVPSSAQLWSSGNGMMHYQAPADGMVYIYDHPAQRLIWSGHLMKGQSVDVDPQKNEIMAGGNVVVNKLAAPGDQKDIYFDPSPVPAPQSSPQSWNNQNTSGGVLVTPNVTVQPSGSAANNAVTVQPGVNVTPAPTNPSNP